MARKTYILTFDRDDDFDYKDFHNKLINLPEVITWAHYIKSSYILVSNASNASILNNKILEMFKGENKSWLLIEVNMGNYNGKLLPKAWEWFKRQGEMMIPRGL